MMMKINALQDRAPFFEELLRYANHPLKAFHMPGHKAGSSWEEAWFRPELLGKLDLTEISALNWAGSLQQAEVLAAQFHKADRSFFLIQGASQGILGVILGAFNPGDTVLVARNCHSSVIHGLILADLTPVYLELDFLEDWGLPTGIKINSLLQKLQEYPESKGMIIANPTYQGIANQVKVYRELIGERLLIIDEAHGGYFEWSGLPGFDAYEVADAWVHGTHKMLGSLTQTGMLHLRQNRIDPERIKYNLELITTTSPSYILLASLDSNRRFLATRGNVLFGKKRPFIETQKRQLAELSLIAVLDNVIFNNQNKTVDPWKICLSFQQCSLSGYEVERILQTEFGIQPEYADLNQVTFFITPWQEEKDIEVLQQAIIEIQLRTGQTRLEINSPVEVPPLIMKPREAALGPSKAVHIRQAIGEVSAATISPYPPGIPLIGPGELIRENEVAFIENIIKYGGTVRGLSPQGTVVIVNRG